MKKLDLGTITMGLDTLKDAFEQNTGIGWSELVDASAIDFAEKNSYAADDTDETIRDLADQIEVAGLLTPLGVIKEGTRYRLFSGERRYKAITAYLHWEKIPCQVFEGVSSNKAQLMLHMANGAREYSPARKLELYEEYNALLRQMKASGEFTGPIQKGVAELLNVSDRQVRTYRTMAEQLTQEEKEAVSSGSLSFGDAKQVAVERAAERKIPEEAGTESGNKEQLASSVEMIQRRIREEAILKEAIKAVWGGPKLYELYIMNVPTPSEAKKLLMQGYENLAGAAIKVKSLEFGEEMGRYVCNEKGVTFFLLGLPTLMVPYSKIDKLVRQMIRDHTLVTRGEAHGVLDNIDPWDLSQNGI